MELWRLQLVWWWLARGCWQRPGAASAKPMWCSAGDDWDPVEASEVIVGGRIASWERRPDRDGAYGAVELHIEVADVWKGALGASDEIIDAASFQDDLPGEAPRWVGAAGACGALDSDPTGKYAVFGLSRDEKGYLRTNRLTTFWLDDAPYDVAALSAVDRGRFRLPALGFGEPARSDRNELLLIASLALAGGCAAVLAGSRRMHRSLGDCVTPDGESLTSS